MSNDFTKATLADTDWLHARAKMDLVEQTRDERPIREAYAIVDEWLKQNDPPP